MTFITIEVLKVRKLELEAQLKELDAQIERLHSGFSMPENNEPGDEDAHNRRKERDKVMGALHDHRFTKAVIKRLDEQAISGEEK